MIETEMLLEALEIGLEAAQEVAADTHAKYAGYKPHRHAAVDEAVRKIEVAIASLKAAQLAAAPVAAQPVTKEFGGIGWQLVYMPDGWTVEIDRIMHHAWEAASKDDRDAFRQFRSLLCAVPVAQPAPAQGERQPDDAKDAARYRWIRDREHNGFNLCGPENVGYFHTSQKLEDGHATYYFGDRLDAAIDAAMKSV